MFGHTLIRGRFDKKRRRALRCEFLEGQVPSFRVRESSVYCSLSSSPTKPPPSTSGSCPRPLGRWRSSPRTRWCGRQSQRQASRSARRGPSVRHRLPKRSHGDFFFFASCFRRARASTTCAASPPRETRRRDSFARRSPQCASLRSSLCEGEIHPFCLSLSSSAPEPSSPPDDDGAHALRANMTRLTAR